MVQNGIFCTIGVQLYIVYYPIIYIRKIKVYRVETMGMGISHWKNGVSGRNLISISTMVLLYEIRYFSRNPTMICLYMESYVE